MIIEHSTTVVRLLRPRWWLVPLVFGILLAVEVANDLYHFDRPAYSLAAVGLPPGLGS